MAGSPLADLKERLRFCLDEAFPLIEEAFQAGRRLGAQEMRQAILAAAQSPSDETPTPLQVSLPAPDVSPSIVRAPRGAVRHAIEQAFRGATGLTEQEISRRIMASGAKVAHRSIGNELRRLKGRHYRQEGGLWFLIASRGETETADRSQDQSAVAVSQATEGDPDGASLAA